MEIDSVSAIGLSIRVSVTEEKMKIVVKNSRYEVAEWTAEYIRKKITNFNPGPERYFTLGLPTGSTPLNTYSKLIKFYKKGSLSFRYVKTFNMDEYVGLPRNHPQSYHSFMLSNFFQHIDIDPKNVYILNGNADDLEKECQKFEDEIGLAGGIHLFLGGIGCNGHIAFNEPGSSVTSRTAVKDLTLETRKANARFYDNVSKVPTQALTVGIGTVMDAREVVILATGSQKSLAVHKSVEQKPNKKWPASALQKHPKTTFVCDEDAAYGLT